MMAFEFTTVGHGETGATDGGSLKLKVQSSREVPREEDMQSPRASSTERVGGGGAEDLTGTSPGAAVSPAE
jgi:hypothetical protein